MTRPESQNAENYVPDDSIAAIIESLHERDEARNRAVALAWNQLESAETETDRTAALYNVARMIGVSDEFHGLFPEIFPPNDTDN